MKNVAKFLVGVALILSTGVSAQKIEPKFEQVGKIVKGIFYHDNGQIAQVGCFKDGRLHGEWVMFAEDGTKISIGTYEEGKRTGEWFFWKSDGQMLREVTYENGHVNNIVEWAISREIL
nr:nicotinic acid mononucleotide adenyltransferase [Allomuricauda sp.]